MAVRDHPHSSVKFVKESWFRNVRQLYRQIDANLEYA
jgi:hypothetical protein